MSDTQKVTGYSQSTYSNFQWELTEFCSVPTLQFPRGHRDVMHNRIKGCANLFEIREEVNQAFLAFNGGRIIEGSPLDLLLTENLAVEKIHSLVSEHPSLGKILAGRQEIDSSFVDLVIGQTRAAMQTYEVEADRGPLNWNQDALRVLVDRGLVTESQSQVLEVIKEEKV